MRWKMNQKMIIFIEVLVWFYFLKMIIFWLIFHLIFKSLKNEIKNEIKNGPKLAQKLLLWTTLIISCLVQRQRNSKLQLIKLIHWKPKKEYYKCNQISRKLQARGALKNTVTEKRNLQSCRQRNFMAQNRCNWNEPISWQFSSSIYV